MDKNYEKVFNILIVKPDDLFSYKDIMALTNLQYKQVTRAIQTLTDRDLIFRYVNPYSGVGRGRGKVAYFGVSEEIYANKTKVS
jgi:DNA-binding MarR family transcriptional regulator